MHGAFAEKLTNLLSISLAFIQIGTVFRFGLFISFDEVGFGMHPDLVFSRTEDTYRVSHSGAEKPAGESDHVKRHRPSRSHVTRAGALRETVGASGVIM